MQSSVNAIAEDHPHALYSCCSLITVFLLHPAVFLPLLLLPLLILLLLLPLLSCSSWVQRVVCRAWLLFGSTSVQRVLLFGPAGVYVCVLWVFVVSVFCFVICVVCFIFVVVVFCCCFSRFVSFFRFFLFFFFFLFVFCVLCFVFCVLCFVFCVLCFVFCVLCFVLCLCSVFSMRVLFLCNCVYVLRFFAVIFTHS
jgi:hypothetical protein